jgi:hypothetical protein
MALPKNVTRIVVPHPERVVLSSLDHPGNWPGQPKATVRAVPVKPSPNVPATYEGLAAYNRRGK